MAMEVFAIGGYNEVGKNMTAIKAGEDIVICDIGIFLPSIINLEEEEIPESGLTAKQLVNIGAIADDSILDKYKDKVKAIVISHAHLDHLAGIPYLAPKYKNAVIIGTPFTIEILKAILREEEINIPNKLKAVNPNSIFRLDKDLSVELINVTHSTPQTAMIAVHTKEGIALYANDFKFDNSPLLGQKPNYKRLKELGKKGVKVMIVESLYATREMKTPSEKVAKELLKDVLLGTRNAKNALFVTTFASHIARLKVIKEFAQRLNRKVLFLGRSMAKYITAAENVGIVRLSKKGNVFGFRRQAEKALREVARNRGQYLVVCTGSQGELGSILDRIAKKELHFSFKEGDQVVFSCKTIPAAVNIANREALEARLKGEKARIFTDIHVSGHASKEDLRDFINLVKPKNIVPAHGETVMTSALADLAIEEGYLLGKNVFVMRDGQKISL